MRFRPVERDRAKMLGADANRKVIRRDRTPAYRATDCHEHIAGENDEPLHLRELGFWNAPGFRPAEFILNHVIGTNGAGVIFKLARTGGQMNPPVTLFPSIGGNTFQLSFADAPLGQYEIQGTGQLPSGWQTLSNVQADGSGQCNTWKTSSREPPHGFIAS